MLLLGVGAALLILGAIGIPVGLGMGSEDARGAPQPTPSRSLPGWRQPPKKVGTNTATLPSEDVVFGSSGEIVGRLTVTVTRAECGAQEIVNADGVGWQWRPSNGQFCLVHLTAKCAPPPDGDTARCVLPPGLQTAVTDSGKKVRVFNADEGRPLRFLNEDDVIGGLGVVLEAPPSGRAPSKVSVVIPYDIPNGETIAGVILYTGYFSRPVEVTVAQ